MTSGGDIREANSDRIGKAGIFTEKPIEDIVELVKILKSGNFSLCINGQVKSL